MNLTTISDIFDTKLNAIVGGVSKDEYEKSIYLTRAQEIFYDALLIGYEETNIISPIIDHLIVVTTLTSSTQNIYGGYVIEFTENVRKILRERATTGAVVGSPLYSNKELSVDEERLSEIEESLRNPFRSPDLNKCLRAVNDAASFNKVQLFINSGLSFGNYLVTYAKDPEPIILETLPTGLEVNGQNTATSILAFDDDSVYKIIDIAINLVLTDSGVYARNAKEEAQ